MNSLIDLLDWGVKWLSESQEVDLDAEAARVDAQVLLCHAIGKNRAYLFAFPESQPTVSQRQHYFSWVQQRAAGTPVAYILGEREFWSLPLYCDNSTLIPRPDTECLVEQVLAQLPDQPAITVLDLGTGTGAIALALAKERPGWHIAGIDKNAAAVALAQKNAQRLGLPVNFSQGDWLQGIPAHSLDLMVSNPPYIDAQDPHLQQGDLRFEPLSALVAGDQGLGDYAILARQGLSCLKPGGYVFLEHGYRQRAALTALLTQLGYQSIRGYSDYAGQPRILSARSPAQLG